jgi:replicative DNA helicase
MQSSDITLEKGLPSNLDAERFVLGSILLDDSAFIAVAGMLAAADFCLRRTAASSGGCWI